MISENDYKLATPLVFLWATEIDLVQGAGTIHYFPVNVSRPFSSSRASRLKSVLFPPSTAHPTGKETYLSFPHKKKPFLYLPSYSFSLKTGSENGLKNSQKNNPVAQGSIGPIHILPQATENREDFCF